MTTLTATELSALVRENLPVATIADLKELAKPDNQAFQEVQGYYTAGDGGGGSFWWDSASSATDNGGTVIAPDAGGVGRWLALGDARDPRRWGAKGDATTNDSAFFTSLETVYSNELIDLYGLTYLVTSIPTGNDYYNGSFKVGATTTEQFMDSLGLSAENYAELDALTGLTDGAVISVAGALSTAVELTPDGAGGTWVYRAGSSATDNTGTVRTATGMGAGRFHRRTDNSEINVRWFEAVGDGVEDDTAAIQAAVDFAPYGGTIYFPSGEYLVSDEIDLTGPGAGVDRLGRGLTIRGDGHSETTAYSGRSRIFGSVAGPIISNEATSGSRPGGSVRNLFINNTNGTAGIGVAISGVVGCVVDTCTIKAWRGVLGIDGTFGLGLHNLIVRCQPSGAPATAIGIYAASHTTMTNIDVTGFGIGLNLWGTEISLSGLRAEVNVAAIIVGYDHLNNVSQALYRASLNGISCEANNYDLIIGTGGLQSSSISAMGTQGSSNAPGGSSTYGIYINGGTSEVTFTSVQIGGTYTSNTFATVGTLSPRGTTFIDCDLGGSFTFDANTPITKYAFINCKYFGTVATEETPAQITAAQTNYGDSDVLRAACTWRLSSDASRAIHGINNTGASQRDLRIINVGAQDIVLSNQSGTEGTASRRIITGTGADITLAADDTAILHYDRTTARWRVLNSH